MISQNNFAQIKTTFLFALKCPTSVLPLLPSWLHQNTKDLASLCVCISISRKHPLKKYYSDLTPCPFASVTLGMCEQLYCILFSGFKFKLNFWRNAHIITAHDEAPVWLNKFQRIGILMTLSKFYDGNTILIHIEKLSLISNL